MSNHLKHSIFWFVFAITVAWIGLSYGGAMGDVRGRNNCVSESIVNAERWIELTGRPARIAVSKIDKERNIDHAQAMGQELDGSWTYLTRHHSDGKLRRWQQHFDVEPYRYLTLEAWITEQEGI